MKILIAPDSYKGSLSAIEVAATILEAFRDTFPNAVIEAVPMADGGEGTIEALIYATKGKLINITVTGPLGEPLSADYGVLGDGETVIVEIAKVVGLPLIPAEKRNPLMATTYGIGEIMRDALNKGYRKFVFGLGGSATNEGGIGLLQALGASFSDVEGNTVNPIAQDLIKVKKVDYSTLDHRIRECSIVIASDVDNVLCGKQGASYIYGSQKGANLQQIQLLDASMDQFARLIENHLQTSYRNIPGSGAAGGLGFCLLTLGAIISSGAKLVAEKIGLNKKLENVDWVITGEGKSDGQTLHGKVPYFIACQAKEVKARPLLISGGLGEDIEPLYQHFVSCHSIVRGPASLEDCMEKARSYLYATSRDVARLIHASSS